MHTVELLDEALTLAGQIGYRIRTEWLDGSGGGDCEIGGQKWIFLDLALGPAEQLEQVLATLRREPAAQTSSMSPQLRQLVEVRKSA